MFIVIWAVIWLPIALPLARLVKWQPAAPISQNQKLTLMLPLYLIAPLLAWGVMIIGEPSLIQTELIFQLSIFKFILFGYGLGITTIVSVYTIEVGMGCLKLESVLDSFSSGWKTLPLLLLVSLFIASVEELIFRGVFVNFLRQDYSLWITAIISSLIFALLHLIWEQRQTFPQLPGLFLMGIVLCLARFVANGNLGLAIGIHGGWVFVLATLDTWDCYSYTDQIQGWIIGKKGQPLASLAGIIVVAFAGIFLWIIK